MKLGLIVGFASVASFAAGAAAGYFVLRRKLEEEYSARLTREVAQSKAYYQTLYKRGELASVEDLAEALHPGAVAAAQAVADYQGRPTKAPVVVRPASQNVFAKPRVDVDWELELRNRTEDAPHILNQEEFMQNETDYTQVTLSYFEADQVLVDSREDVIHDSDADELIGLIHLKRFGDWSNDPNVVYVRNHVKEIDVEILRSEGSYSKEVLGLEDDDNAVEG